jgi:hypothetical protein
MTPTNRNHLVEVFSEETGCRAQIKPSFTTKRILPVSDEHVVLVLHHAV